MEVPLPKKKEKEEKQEKKIVEEEKDVKKEIKRESLGVRILNLLFGWPPYDPDLINRIDNILRDL